MGCRDVPGGAAAAAPPPPAAPARGSPGGRVSLPGGRCRAGSVSSQVTPRGGAGVSPVPRPLAGPARGGRGRTGRATPYGGAVAARTKGERRAGQGHRQTPGGARLPPSLNPYPAATAFPGGLFPRDRPPGARDAPSLRGSAHGQRPLGASHPRRAGALRREAPCPPRRGGAYGVRRALSGSARARLSLERAAGRCPPCPLAPGSGLCAAPGRWRSRGGAAPPVRSPRCPGKGGPHGPASWTAGMTAGSSCAPDR